MDANAFPQCMSALRFHAMIQEGDLSENELLALATDRRLGREYAALRQCDDAFQEMIEAGNQEIKRQQQQRKMHGNGHSHGPGAGGEESTVEGMSNNEVKYVGYVHCLGTGLCPDSLKEWYSCLEQAKAGERPVESCVAVKRMLERCLRAETDALFRTSQKHVFRPAL